MLNKRADKLELLRIAEAVALEKSIDKELIISSMETGIAKAAKSKFGQENEIKVSINRDSGDIELFRKLIIAENPENANTEIKLEDAINLNEINKDKAIGDEVLQPLPSFDFGRIAAQTAKQVISFNVREAERERQFNDFIDKKDSILSGIVKRLEFGNVIADLGRTEAIIQKNELIPRENIKAGDRIKAYCYDVRREPRGQQIFLSRAHPKFMEKLFVQEVPEIYDGLIEIKSSSRDPGSRAKICVKAVDTSLDPVGACVGMRGSRVQAVVNELQGEKIDIVNWSEDPAILVSNALSPAEVQRVNVDAERKKLDVILTEENLSKAIGRRGQNVRLATKLLNYEINIMTDAEDSERRQLEFKEKTENFVKNLELDETLGQLLVAEGFSTIDDIKDSSVENLMKIEGIEEDTAKALIERAKEFHQKDQEDISTRIKELGLEDTLINLKGLTPGMLVTLGEQKILTLEDFADLASDELTGGFDVVKGERVKIQGYLEDFALSKEEADELIMSARNIVYKDWVMSYGKKKTKLTISGSAKKSIKNIEIAKTQSKNAVVIEKQTGKFPNRGGSFRPSPGRPKPTSSFSRGTGIKPSFAPKSPPITNDFERRKLAEQRATKRLKGDSDGKDKKTLKSGTKKRELKLTVSRALSDEIEARERSLASVKRARLKENKNLSKDQNQESLKPVKRDINIPEAITVRELANRMAEQSSNVIKYLFGMGVTVTINQTLAADTAEFLVKEFGHNPIREEKAEEIIQKIKATRVENLKNRPPIVTVMGHVDHGKTSVLDVLRSANVVSGEFGGITQHIGAYQIESQDNKLTFIDTPGHAAFTEMRARGSKLTDVVVLVVAADDGVKPQTIESIKHAKAANVPIVVAINKCDLPDADPQKIKNQLLEHELVAEDLSGDTLMVEISAKTKLNLDKLVESIILQAEILDLKTDYESKATGIVLESKIDVGRGPVATIIVTTGTLKKGDFFVSGLKWGKVRAIINDKGKNIDEASPSTPVEILGINGAAKAGDDFIVLESEKEAKTLSENRAEETKDGKNPLTFATQESAFSDKSSEELNLIIKSDVHGSSEAIKNAISQIKHDEVKPKIILADIGMVTETDVTLAKSIECSVNCF